VSLDPPSSDAEPQGEELAERVYERVAEDESLRGALSDDGYGALLDWCANRIVNVALEPEVGTLDELADAFRETMRALVAAAEGGDSAALAELPPVAVDGGCFDELGKALEGGGNDPDRRAIALAEALTEYSP
jgi:hypothetical protein